MWRYTVPAELVVGGSAVTPVPAAPAETVEHRFDRLARVWHAETAHLSSSTRMFNHPAFREIIAVGLPVVPLMLRELARGPSLWVWALPAITGDDPVAAPDRGDIAKMTEAWLRWGREHGYQW